jgi:hypothetical protein
MEWHAQADGSADFNAVSIHCSLRFIMVAWIQVLRGGFVFLELHIEEGYS